MEYNFKRSIIFKVGHGFIEAEGLKETDKYIKDLQKLNSYYYDRALAICDGILGVNSKNIRALRLKRQIIDYLEI